MIDGFRYALTGHAEGSLIFGGLLTGLTLILAIVAHVFGGYRLKAAKQIIYRHIGFDKD